MKHNFFENVSEEKKSLFCFGTALILLLALMFYGVVPLMEEAVLAKRQCLDLKGRIKIYQAFSKVENSSQIAREQSKKLAALEKRLPKNLQQEVLMAELHSVAEQNGVKLKTLRQIGKGASKKQGVTLYLEGVGEYEKVLEFLETVEKEGSFKNLQEFVAKGDESGGNLEVSGVIVAYNN